MTYNFIFIFAVLVVTFIIAVILVKILRPGKKEDHTFRYTDTFSVDQRQHPRVDVNWPVVVETPNGTENAVIRNIAIGGAFIICENPLPINETARLTIQTSLEEPLILTCKAIWTNISVRNDKIVNKGMRIQFINNAGRDLKLLHQALIVATQQIQTGTEISGKTGEEDSRRDARVDVKWPVEMETSRGIVQAETRHVSISGTFISCPDPLPVMEQFRLSINIPKFKTTKLNAEVIWSNANVPEEKIINRGMGVKFINNSRDDLKPLSIALLKTISDSYRLSD